MSESRLLSLPNEIISQIIAIVAEKDLTADGDVLSLSATCRRIHSLVKPHARDFLNLRSQYGHLEIVEKLDLLQLLLDINSGKTFHWHVRSIDVGQINQSWSGNGRRPGVMQHVTECLNLLRPMLESARLPPTWFDRTSLGSEMPLVSLLLLHLPRLQVIKPSCFPDRFTCTLAFGRSDDPTFWSQRSPVLARLEAVTFSYQSSEGSRASSTGSSRGAIFMGGVHHEFPHSYLSGRKEFVSRITFEDLHSSPEDVERLLMYFRKVRKVTVRLRRRDTESEMSGIVGVFRKCGGNRFTDFTLTTRLNNLRLRIQSFASFTMLRTLILEFSMFLDPDSDHVQSLADLMPASIQSMCIRRIPVEDSFLSQARSLFWGFKTELFSDLQSIVLLFHSGSCQSLHDRTADTVDGLRAASIEVGRAQIGQRPELGTQPRYTGPVIRLELLNAAKSETAGQGLYSTISLAPSRVEANVT